MPDLKLLRIEEGDNQKVLVDKINSNFSDILTFGGGPYGKIGDQGPQGDSGQIGPTGSYGDIGSRGSIWTIGATDPGLTGYINNDFWLNTRPELGNPIYQFSSTGWNQYGFGILSADIFKTYANLPTLGGNSTYTGYTLRSANPSNYTLVLSDNSLAGASASTNPQYSKVVIAINGGATGKNLMEFTKGSYSASTSFNTKTPRFHWTSTATTTALKYGLSWKNGDSLFFDIPLGQLKLSTTTNGGSNSRYRSTGFNLNLTGSQGLSVTTGGNFILNHKSTGTLLLSNRNIGAGVLIATKMFGVSFNFTNPLNNSLPPLWLESTLSNSGNLRHRANVISSRVSRLFQAYTLSENIFDVKANGEVWYNKRINSIQPAQTVTPTVTGNTNIAGPTASVQWYTAIPGAIYSGAGGTASQRISSNNGSDFVISPSTFGPTDTIGICLWTPATGGTKTGNISTFDVGENNGGWLNMLNEHEAISFSVRTDSDSKYIRFLGLNTSNTFSDAPYAPSGSAQAIDLTGATSSGASHIDFTIMNISRPSNVYPPPNGGTGAANRWFKVYYSAYGGDISGSKCGVMYTTNSIAF
jgi:hypothetical protein